MYQNPSKYTTQTNQLYIEQKVNLTKQYNIKNVKITKLEGHGPVGCYKERLKLEKALAWGS